VDFTVPLLALLGLLVLAMVTVAGFAVRRRALQRHSATFDCSLRTGLASHGRGWVLGVARYTDDGIDWFRVFSWSPRPKHRFARHEINVRGRRLPTGPEALALTPGAVIIQLGLATGVVELGMAEDALTGFLAWLEAGPPGRDVSVA